MEQNLFNIVKSVVEELRPSIKIINLTETFNLDNCSKYVESLNGNPDVMLFAEKTDANKEYFYIFPDSAFVLFYGEDYRNCPEHFEKREMKIAISRLINGTDNACCVCFLEPMQSASCCQCQMSICNKCLLQMAGDERSIVDGSVMKVLCPVCNTNSIIIPYPITAIPVDF